VEDAPRQPLPAAPRERMRPAFSVVFLTTLIGAGQGLFLALYAADAAGRAEARFLAMGAAASVAFAAAGLIASVFHLGRPERAWRSAAMWRTSWLSREVIALPLFMASVTAWGAAHYFRWPGATALGLLALAACLALFVCTAMIYACVKFLQEWASPLTVLNFTLIGAASGCTLAVFLAAFAAPGLARAYAWAAVALTLAALAGRVAALVRNARLKPRSTPQSAIGVRHPKVVQKSMGFMGGSFNTREFFSGASPAGLDAVRNAFVSLGFVLPMALLLGGLATGWAYAFAAAFVVQYAGIVAERWHFLAQSNHAQNLYYQCAS
jgi:sulfite dehydrogenase (quinone) subunit SoeC